MLRSFLTLLIVTTNLFSILDSYKINIDETSKIIEAYDQQDPDLQEDEFSTGDSYKRSNGRVVIGKWRNNGEALEPKWRDGDSVPLAPFSTISFENGWGKEPNSRDDYQIEPDGFIENGNKYFEANLMNENTKDKENLHPQSNRRDKHDEDSEAAENSDIIVVAHSDLNEGKHKNDSPRNERQFNVPGNFEKETDLHGSDRRVGVSKLSSKFREPLRRDNGRENIQGGIIKYRETLENYPKDEYELFENQDDDPRPRKRRPPENHEYPGSLIPNNQREESQQVVLQTQSANMANDIRRYLIIGHDPAATTRNPTNSQDNVQLKMYLKMQGNSLSLSEILQQKNLTLSDLLKGKPNAIDILKSNDNNTAETLPENKTTEWKTIAVGTTEKSLSPRRTIDVRISSKNSNSNVQNYPASILNYPSPTNSDDVESTTTIEPTTNAKSELITTRMDESSSTPTTIINDIRTVPSEKSEEEFLKPLENRESLSTWRTTVVADVTELAITEGQVLAFNEKKIPDNNNNDDDEIMEFSDYPAAKMPKFMGAVIYETQSLSNKRRIVPLSAIRKTNYRLDHDTKLSIERILSTTSADGTEDHQKIVDTGDSKNISNLYINNQTDESKPMNNKTHGMKFPDNENINLPLTEYRNSLNASESKYPADENGRTVPLKNEDVIKKEHGMSGEELLSQDSKNLTFNHKLHEIIIPKVDPQSRTEILELFSSGSSAERLERLLASRNMTIEELIALRQRGSSRVHFEQVFKINKEQSSTPLIRNIKTETKNYIEDNMELLNAQNSTRDKPEKENEYSTIDLINKFSADKNISVFDKINRDFYRPVGEINQNIEMKKTEDSEENLGYSDAVMTLENLPIGNNIQTDSDGSSYYTSIEAVKLPVLEDEIKLIPDITKNRKAAVIAAVSSGEIGRVEEILNNDLKSLKNSQGIGDYDYSEKKALSKVKPSIIASGGILGVTVVVFLSIFIACRIQQKKKFAYKNSFAKAVFHNPVMTARKLSNTSSINSIMIDVVATSTPKRTQKHETYESEDFEAKSDIDNDSLDANDSWDTIPDFMK